MIGVVVKGYGRVLNENPDCRAVGEPPLQGPDPKAGEFLTDGAGPASGFQLLFQGEPQPVRVVGPSHVVRSDPAVRLGQHDGIRVGDRRNTDLTL
jgi:hypothetical protein